MAPHANPSEFIVYIHFVDAKFNAAQSTVILGVLAPAPRKQWTSQRRSTSFTEGPYRFHAAKPVHPAAAQQVQQDSLSLIIHRVPNHYNLRALLPGCIGQKFISRPARCLFQV